MCPVVVVSSYSVVPALMNRKDGGATPMNVPKKNESILTPITGDAKFINQFGSIGVIRKNIM